MIQKRVWYKKINKFRSRQYQYTGYYLFSFIPILIIREEI